MKTISPLDKTHTAVPLVKYQQLFDVAAQAAELLKSQPRDNAKEALASLTAFSARLTDEQKALARAQTALRDARNAAKRTRALAAKLVPTAITLGELLEITSIANFTPPDDSWAETVEALAVRFEAHDKTGKGIAAMLRAMPEKRRAAESAVTHATEHVDRASQAFSGTYRHLSTAIFYARAVLLNLGISVPSTAKPVSKKRKVVEPAPQKPAEPMPALVPVAPTAV